MKTIVYDKSIPREPELREAEKPVPEKEEILLRVWPARI